MSEYSSVWREFEANEITHSAAHYLLAVASHEKRGTAARGADIARRLGVSRAAASLQLKALRENGLVTVDEHHEVHLTPAGADIVARVAGKREVVRVFLQEMLGVSPRMAELDACKVEHLLSEESGAALVRLIHFLRSDHPSAGACREAFRELTAGCPPMARCDLCDEVCLLRAEGGDAA